MLSFSGAHLLSAALLVGALVSGVARAQSGTWTLLGDSCGGVHSHPYADPSYDATYGSRFDDVVFAISTDNQLDATLFGNIECPPGYRHMSTAEGYQVFDFWGSSPLTATQCPGKTGAQEYAVYDPPVSCGWSAYNFGGVNRQVLVFADSNTTNEFVHVGCLADRSYESADVFAEGPFAGAVCTSAPEPADPSLLWMSQDDSCTGRHPHVYADPSYDATFGDRFDDVSLAVSRRYRLTESYYSTLACPDGLRWMTAAEGRQLFDEQLAEHSAGNCPVASAGEDYTTYDRCGFNQYVHPDGWSRRVFVFQDSDENGEYLFGGCLADRSYTSVAAGVMGFDFFGGIVCTSAPAPDPAAWQLVTDSCGGVHPHPYNTGSFPSVSFVISEANVGSSDLFARFSCPDGSRWMPSAEARLVFTPQNADSITSNCPVKTGAAEYSVWGNSCGWSGYDFGGARRELLLLSDSDVTRDFVDVGCLADRLYTSPRSVFVGAPPLAGIVCTSAPASEAWMLTTDTCAGLHPHPYPEFGDVAFAISADIVATPALLSAVVCPDGYRWMSTAEGEALFDDQGAAFVAGGNCPYIEGDERYAIYGNDCGWTNYFFEGVQRSFLLFNDSESSLAYMHVGCLADRMYRADAFSDIDVPFAGAVCISALLPSQGCAAGEAPASPALVNSSVSGFDLVLEFESDPALTGLSWNFVGGAGCDNDGTDATGGWVHDASGCPATHTLTKPVTALLATCGFSAEPVDGGDVWYYEAVVEATAVNQTSAVFGDNQTRTDVTPFRLRVEFPKNASVSASSVVFGPLISQARVTTQAADTSVAPAAFQWTLATSVQHPYELVAPATTDAAPAGFDAALAVAGSETCSGADECTQRFTVSGTASASTCSLDSSAALTFTVKCRDGYTGSCDLPSPATVAASFAFETDDFCPRVVEVASITPTLTTYAGSAGGTVSTNYILETTLFGRVTADVEAGVQAKRTTLTGLEIVSSCTGCADDTVQPFTDGLPAAATAYDFVWEDGGRVSSAAGEVQTDFSFTLNTNSLSFDNDATTGEAQITLTAFVSVEYDTPSAQGLERSYRVQAVSGPGSVGSSASANFGVSSAPAGTAGGSSSTAGSTVLGVSTGTAALAAVGLAAVAAVAVGAAVAARRRRTPLSLKHTSSSVELNDTASVQA